MRILVDTGVFSASISRRRRARFEPQVGLMAGNQIFLAAVTVAELRYGALVAGWGDQRRQRLEQSIAATTVVPVSDSLLTTAAELRHACRQVGHALHESVHANDLWIAASAVHIGEPLLTADAVFDDVPGLNIHR
ncbi:MAG TPA: PIN domain-containing protein [Acidimicrobiales bacterium]|nr:PIN domain-containing protein [Acidimicrobiales bacterium]